MGLFRRKSADNKILFNAVRKNDLSAVKAALKKGADANAKDEVGRTALICASEKQHTDIVSLLKNAGAR